MKNAQSAKGKKDRSYRGRLQLLQGDTLLISRATGYHSNTVLNVLKNGLPNSRIWACYEGIIKGRETGNAKLRDKLIARELSKAQAREMEVI